MLVHFESNTGQRMFTADLSNRQAETTGPGLDVSTALEGKPVHRLYRTMQGSERSEEFIAAETACATRESQFGFWLAHVVFKGRTPPHVPQDLSMAHTFCVPKVCEKDELQPIAAQWVQGNIRHIVLNAISKGLWDSGVRFSEEEAAQELERIREATSQDFPVHVWLESFEQKTSCEQELHAQWGYFWEHSGQRFFSSDSGASGRNGSQLLQQEEALKAWRLCKRADFGFQYWLVHARMSGPSGDQAPLDGVFFTFGLCLPKSCAINEAEPIASFIVRDVMTDEVLEESKLDILESDWGIHDRAEARQWLKAWQQERSPNLATLHERLLGSLNVNMRLELLGDTEPKAAPGPGAVREAFTGAPGRGPAGVPDLQADPTIGPMLVDEELPCDLPRRFVFLDTSWHTGARLDVAAVLASLNQTVLLPRFLGVPKDPEWPQLQTKGLGSLTAPETGSEVFHAMLRHPWTGGRIGKLAEREVRRHFESLKDNPVLSEVDALICTGALSSCEIWMPFNKTIVAVSSMGGRYSLGRCTAAEWQRLDENLRALAASEGPRHILAANGRWSAEFVRLYVGAEPTLLESLPWFYVQPAVWQPTRPEILLHCFKASPPKMCPELAEEMTRRVMEHQAPGEEKWLFRDIYDLYPSYKLEDLVQHRAVVAVPYGHFNFAVAEIYSLNVPLFLPTAHFLTTLCPGKLPCYVNGSLIAPVGDTFENLADGLGCNQALEAEGIHGTGGSSLDTGRRCARHEQWLWRQRSSGQYAELHEDVAPQHPHPLPESACTNRQAWAYWLQFIEAYRYPHAVTFSSWSELAVALETTDFRQLHELMRSSAVRRARNLRKRWCHALRRALVDPAPRAVPRTYEEALAGLGIAPGGSLLQG